MTFRSWVLATRSRVQTLYLVRLRSNHSYNEQRATNEVVASFTTSNKRSGCDFYMNYFKEEMLWRLDLTVM